MKNRRPGRNRTPARRGGNLANQTSSESVITTEATAFSGPLPPPEILIRYNEAVPDAAERIITMAEQQSKHRIQLEEYVIRGESRRSDWGLIAGVLVVAMVLVAAGYITSLGYPWHGAGLGIADLASLVVIFVYGTERRKQERQDRMDEMARR